MQNAQNLLDSFGSPPAEVCIDWAWQLVALAEAGGLAPEFSWTDLCVSHDGSLAATNLEGLSDTCDSSLIIHGRSFQNSIKQLIGWSGCEAKWNSNKPFESLQSVQMLVRELASRIPAASEKTQAINDLQGLPKSRINAKPIETTCSQSADETTSTNELSDSNSLDLTSDAASINLALKDSLIEPTSVRPAKRATNDKNARRLVYMGCAVVVAFLGLIVWWQFGTKGKSEGLAESKGNRNTNSNGGSDNSEEVSASRRSSRNSSSQSSSGRSKKSPKSSTSDIDQLLSGSSTAESAQSTELAALGPSSENKDAAIDLTLNNSSKSESSILLESVSTQASVSASPGSSKSATSSSTTEGSAALSSADAGRLKLDVANETSQESLAKMLASSTSADTKVNAMNESTADNNASLPAAHLLNVEELFQIQAIPNKVRVREPTWELRLSSTSSMNVEPAGIQTLVEKSAVRWILSSRELKPRKGQEPTKVAIIAEMANKRGDVRWTIVAGTQDLPNLRFPMNQERLDQLLTMLQNYQQRLSLSIEQIKAAMDLPDFPKELKSTWTAQRRSFESEVKLTTRARQVVADASMLTSWMDRTIEVHGRLLDTIGNKSDVVLEFGQAEPKQDQTVPVKESDDPESTKVEPKSP